MYSFQLYVIYLVLFTYVVIRVHHMNVSYYFLVTCIYYVDNSTTESADDASTDSTLVTYEGKDVDASDDVNTERSPHGARTSPRSRDTTITAENMMENTSRINDITGNELEDPTGVMNTEEQSINGRTVDMNFVTETNSHGNSIYCNASLFGYWYFYYN